MSPVVFAFFRQLGATPILEIIALIKEGVFPEVRDFKWFVLVGISGVFMSQFLYVLAIYFSGALLATILQLLNTPLTAGLSILMKVEKFAILKIIGISCSVIGAGVMTGLGTISLDRNKVIGMVLAIIQGFFVAFFVVFSKKKLLWKYPSLTVTAGIHVSSIPFMTIACFSLERDISKFVPPKSALLPIGYAILFHSVSAYMLFMFANSRLDPSIVSAFGTTNPLFGSILSVIVLHEKFETKDIIGGLLILSGLGCVLFQRFRDSKAEKLQNDIEIDLKEINTDEADINPTIELEDGSADLDEPQSLDNDETVSLELSDPLNLRTKNTFVPISVGLE